MASQRNARGPWSQDEDDRLRALVLEHGGSNWVKISADIQTRSPKQCRERWHQNLKPGLDLSPITEAQGRIIERMYAEIGPRWADIARALGNRSDNAVKNWWNGGVNRRKRRDSKFHKSPSLYNNIHQIRPPTSAHSQYAPYLQVQRSLSAGSAADAQLQAHRQLAVRPSLYENQHQYLHTAGLTALTPVSYPLHFDTRGDQPMQSYSLASHDAMVAQQGDQISSPSETALPSLSPDTRSASSRYSPSPPGQVGLSAQYIGTQYESSSWIDNHQSSYGPSPSQHQQQQQQHQQHQQQQQQPATHQHQFQANSMYENAMAVGTQKVGLEDLRLPGQDNEAWKQQVMQYAQPQHNGIYHPGAQHVQYHVQASQMAYLAPQVATSSSYDTRLAILPSQPRSGDDHRSYAAGKIVESKPMAINSILS